MENQNTGAQAPDPACDVAENHLSEPEPYGLIHDDSPPTAPFTVVDSHPAQHEKRSLTAIGLAVHIQSLPAGSSVDITSLTEQFPEDRTWIPHALRELEAHGYLRRDRVPTPNGKLTTRTVWRNQPGHP
ncbi:MULTISPECIES: hypothetical protein [unclassified Streptomyces]|uniref:hypothetical protein n=1 Tax=unclassified Streptomyces TaxID=2593676 RepID=UPI001660EB9C|nr:MULTISPECIES: hypothetical protein [unclassified Streptomyces]